MPLEVERINFILERIETATANSFSGAIKQLFEYINSSAKENSKYRYYEKERVKWQDWPGDNILMLLGIPQWKTPENYKDSKSLSYHLFKKLIEDKNDAIYLPKILFRTGNDKNNIVEFNKAFFPYFRECINDILKQEKARTNITNRTVIRNKIFIIHGHDEARWRELEKIVEKEFHLKPIVLMEQPDMGSTALIEKFEHYAPQCSFAIAIFTPDDQIESGGKKIFQARPNTIFELGWFCGRLGRKRVLLLLKEGTDVFSDFQGIIQKRFKNSVKEVILDIKRELISEGILKA